MLNNKFLKILNILCFIIYSILLSEFLFIVNKSGSVFIIKKKSECG